MRAASRHYVIICVAAGYLASVLAILIVVEGRPQNINTQTVTIEQVDTVEQLIKKELVERGLRTGMARPSSGDGPSNSDGIAR